jgi:hypothetical protein
MRCGLRITDALGLPGDCIVRDANGAPYLRYYNHKMKREALVPVDEELEHAIGEHRQRLRTRWPEGNSATVPETRRQPRRAAANRYQRLPQGASPLAGTSAAAWRPDSSAAS